MKVCFRLCSNLTCELNETTRNGSPYIVHIECWVELVPAQQTRYLLPLRTIWAQLGPFVHARAAKHNVWYPLKSNKQSVPVIITSILLDNMLQKKKNVGTHTELSSPFATNWMPCLGLRWLEAQWHYTSTVKWLSNYTSLPAITENLIYKKWVKVTRGTIHTISRNVTFKVYAFVWSVF